ncbi:hypothetical protein G9A89_019534 [Geosiphon pyriformis]|nr:hypothetical protein G9A89_019534 [Geosiphon pyriformis]
MDPSFSFETLENSMGNLSNLDVQGIGEIYFALTAMIETEELNTQKKGYKILNKFIHTEQGRLCVLQNIDHLQIQISKTAVTTLAPAKKDRLLTILKVIKLLPTTDLHMIPDSLSEVILSTKEVNAKARMMAYEVLVLMGNKMKEGGVVVMTKIPEADPDTPNVNASIDEFIFGMVVAGLAATTSHMISATITSLSRLLFEFKESLDQKSTHQLLDTMDRFVKHRDREIVKSALGFIKVAVISLPVETVSPHLHQIIPAILTWSRVHASHFKARVKHIFERLLRRFDYNVLVKHTPEGDQKFLMNIRKQKERTKRKKKNDTLFKKSKNQKEENLVEDFLGLKPKKPGFSNAYEDALFGSESESETSEDDDLGASHQQKHQRGKKNMKNAKGVWIKEERDIPVDFLDKDAALQIFSVKPEKIKAHGSKTAKVPFKISWDGRIVINDSKEDHEVQKPDSPHDDVEMLDTDNHYIDAKVSNEGFTRGQHNKISFNQRRNSDKFKSDQVEPIDAVAIRNAKNLKAGNIKIKKEKRIPVGQEYKAKNADGDIKRKGKPDPYAYIPLTSMYRKAGQKGPKISLKSKGKVQKRR